MLTAEGAIVGTPQYMAPEQLQGLAADARTDMFAFGAVAYEMLTGTRAFDDSSQAALIAAILRDQPAPMEERVPEIPTPLARTLSRCLAKDPDERWQTASDLLFRLWTLASSSGAAGDAVPQPKRSPWIERSAWIGLVAAIIIAGVIWFHRRGSSVSEDAAPFPPVVFSVTPAHGASLASFSTPFAVSPDEPLRRRRWRRWRPAALAPVARFRWGPAAAEYGGRQYAVLVAGQPVDRLLCVERFEQSARVDRRDANHRE